MRRLPRPSPRCRRVDRRVRRSRRARPPTEHLARRRAGDFSLSAAATGCPPTSSGACGRRAARSSAATPRSGVAVAARPRRPTSRRAAARRRHRVGHAGPGDPVGEPMRPLRGEATLDAARRRVKPAEHRRRRGVLRPAVGAARRGRAAGVERRTHRRRRPCRDPRRRDLQRARRPRAEPRRRCVALLRPWLRVQPGRRHLLARDARRRHRRGGRQRHRHDRHCTRCDAHRREGAAQRQRRLRVVHRGHHVRGDAARRGRGRR